MDNTGRPRKNTTSGATRASGNGTDLKPVREGALDGIPKPLPPENREATSSAVVQHNADSGVAWDGEFDRCCFIEGYYIVGLSARTLLGKFPGGRVSHDPRLTWNTIDEVRAVGGVPVQSKTGHASIKKHVRRENALYGVEISAHQ